MPSYWEQYKKKKTDYQKQAAKYTKPQTPKPKPRPRRPVRDRGRRPRTPSIVSEPPTPTITPPTPSPAFAGLQQAGYSPAMAGMGGTAEAFAAAGVAPAPSGRGLLPGGQAWDWRGALLGGVQPYQGGQVGRGLIAAPAPYAPGTGKGAPGMYPSPSDWWSGPTQGSWGTTSVDPYLFDDPGGGGGGGYGYAPAPRRYYAGGGQAAMRGTQQGYSTGLINWRIGL